MQKRDLICLCAAQGVLLALFLQSCAGSAASLSMKDPVPQHNECNPVAQAGERSVQASHPQRVLSITNQRVEKIDNKLGETKSTVVRHVGSVLSKLKVQSAREKVIHKQSKLNGEHIKKNGEYGKVILGKLGVIEQQLSKLGEPPAPSQDRKRSLPAPAPSRSPPPSQADQKDEGSSASEPLDQAQEQQPIVNKDKEHDDAKAWAAQFLLNDEYSLSEAKKALCKDKLSNKRLIVLKAGQVYEHKQGGIEEIKRFKQVLEKEVYHSQGPSYILLQLQCADECLRRVNNSGPQARAIRSAYASLIQRLCSPKDTSLIVRSMKQMKKGVGRSMHSLIIEKIPTLHTLLSHKKTLDKTFEVYRRFACDSNKAVREGVDEAMSTLSKLALQGPVLIPTIIKEIDQIVKNRQKIPLDWKALETLRQSVLKETTIDGLLAAYELCHDSFTYKKLRPLIIDKLRIMREASSGNLEDIEFKSEEDGKQQIVAIYGSGQPPCKPSVSISKKKRKKLQESWEGREKSCSIS